MTRIEPPSLTDRAQLPAEDRWILSRLDRLVEDVDRLLGEFQLNEAGRRIYDFLWGDYCDWYVELAKVRLREQDSAADSRPSARDPRPVLVHVLDTGLRLLHPYMPFVTEELWQRLRPCMAEAPAEAGSAEPAEALIAAPFPQAEPGWRDEEAERQIDDVIEIVRAIRNIRSEKRVEPARYIEAFVVTSESLDGVRPHIEALARIRPLRIVSDTAGAPGEGAATAVLSRAQVVVPLAELLDADAERSRLGKEIEETETYLKRLDGKLSNEQFRSKAPQAVVAAEEARQAEAQTKLEGLQRALAQLN